MTLQFGKQCIVAFAARDAQLLPYPIKYYVV